MLFRKIKTCFFPNFSIYSYSYNKIAVFKKLGKHQPKLVLWVDVKREAKLGTLESSITWPPLGWTQFKDIKSSFCQALAKNASRGKIYGLQYKIETVSLFKNEKKYLRYEVLIDGWEYSILNESIEYPVLSFTLFDHFDGNLPQECYIADIRSYSSLIPHTRRSAARAVSAGIFLMKQISAGFVPDVNRVLRVYKLHPTQTFLYSAEKKLQFDLRSAFYKGNQKGTEAKQA